MNIGTGVIKCAARVWHYGIGFLWMAVSASAWADVATELRDWRIEDSIAVRYVSNLDGDLYAALVPRRDESTMPLSARWVAFSPDHRYFFFVTHAGVLANDSNSYRLTVMASADVERALRGAGKKAPTPVATVTFDSMSSRRAAIGSPAWDQDSRGIVFRAATMQDASKNNEVLQLYRLEVPSGNLRTLTTSTEPMSTVDYRDDGVLFSTRRSNEKEPDSLYPMWRPDRRADSSLRIRKVVPATTRFFCVYRGGAAKDAGTSFDNSWIAPGGRYAVALNTVKGEQHFVLLDLQSCQGTTLTAVSKSNVRVRTSTNNSIRQSPMAVWIDGAKRVALIGARLPEPRGPGDTLKDARNDERSGPHILEYELQGGRWNVVESQQEPGPDGVPLLRYVLDAQEETGGRRFVVHYQGAQKEHIRVAFRFANGKWVSSPAVTRDEKTAAPGRKTGDLNVFVRQGINAPPMVVASEGRRELDLLEPDPALKGVWRAEAQAVSWSGSGGEKATGWLFLPRRQSEHVPLPLVIQVSGHIDPRVFAPDGAVPAGYAAQVLAARGFAVLNILSVRSGGLQEGPAAVAQFDAVVEALASRGLIDRARVGAVGHSRMGYQTLYAVSHPGKSPLAAAAVLDSFNGSFSAFLRQASVIDDLAAPVNGYGGTYEGLFWEKKSAWLEGDPVFTADRVRTPTLFASHGFLPTGTDLAGTDSVMGAFRLNERPLEWIWLPEASHFLYRPRERQVEMQSVVEWMQFWLQDVNPADPETAARWIPLRKMQQAVTTQQLQTSNP